jgi:glycosyltransferase involved in cell wall biosynthesis
MSHLRRRRDSATPSLSVIVIGYRMAGQLANTLKTLLPGYQRGIAATDYEVVLVENASDDCLPDSVIGSLPGNFKYFLREEAGNTPVPAINFAFQQCRGDYIGLIMDGARMLSPGVLETAAMARALSADALTAVPGYHLGEQEQHFNEDPATALEDERKLLAGIDWESDGYELFRVATFSGANRSGYLHPIMECNCLFASRDNYAAIGFADPQFTLHGGGSINLHMYRSLGLLPGTQLFVTPGEGSFHQYHGGVTTSAYDDREAEIERHRTQLHSLWPGGFHALRRAPTLLGRIPLQAQPFLQESLVRSQNRLKKMRRAGMDPWPDDPQEATP